MLCWSWQFISMLSSSPAASVRDTAPASHGRELGAGKPDEWHGWAVCIRAIVCFVLFFKLYFFFCWDVIRITKISLLEIVQFHGFSFICKIVQPWPPLTSYGIFPSTQINPGSHEEIVYISGSPSPLAMTVQLSVTMNLSILDIVQKWEHICQDQRFQILLCPVSSDVDKGLAHSGTEWTAF